MVERRNALLRDYPGEVGGPNLQLQPLMSALCFWQLPATPSTRASHPWQVSLSSCVWSTTTTTRLATLMIRWCFLPHHRWQKLDSGNSAAYKAEFVRCEAIEDLALSLDLQSPTPSTSSTSKDPCNQGSRLAAGQPCAYWRWTRRGAKKTWKLEDGDGFYLGTHPMLANKPG